MMWVKFVPIKDRPATWEVQLSASGFRLGEIEQQVDGTWRAVVWHAEGDKSLGGWASRSEAALFLAGAVRVDREVIQEHERPA